MKSERRHELQSNSLALWLYQAPDFFRRHGSKLVTLAILAVLVVILILRMRLSAAEEVRGFNDQLARSRQIVEALRMQPGSIYSDQGMTPARAKVDAFDPMQDIIDKTKDRALLARAYELIGEYHLALAHYPIGEGTPPPPADRSLADAEKAYSTVLSTYADDHVMSALSRLGLATIEEDRGFAATQKNPSDPEAAKHWNQAKAYYDQVVSDDKAMEAHKDAARLQLKLMDEIRKPVLIAEPKHPAATTSATTAPTTMALTVPSPATNRSTTVPSAAPASQPTSTPPATIGGKPAPGTGGGR